MPPASPGALYLAIESSGPVGSVALGEGDRVVARRALDHPVRFSSDLIPAVAAVLADAGAARTDLAGLVVGSGPGSFTGVRVAAATAKGLAHGLGVPLWAISSLEAAAVAGGGAGLRYVLFDARGDRIYGGCWEVDGDRAVLRLPPHAAHLAEVIADAPIGAAFLGDGAVRHGAALRAAGRLVLVPPAGIPSADALLRLRPGRPAVERADRWEPDYVKASSAERARAG